MSVPQPYTVHPNKHILTPDEAREWWLWTFTGQIAAALASKALTTVIPELSVGIAKRVIEELEKGA